MAPDPKDEAPKENLEIDQKVLEDLDEDQASDVKGGARRGRTRP